MEITFTNEQETRLAELASYWGQQPQEVVMEAVTRLLAADQQETLAAIAQPLQEMMANQGRPAAEALAQLKAELGL